MERPKAGLAERIGAPVQSALGRVEILALFPLIVLIADGFGFDNIAMVTAFGLSALLALSLFLQRRPAATASVSGTLTGKATLMDALEDASLLDGRDTACLLVQVEGWSELMEVWGLDAAQDIAQRTEDRIRTALRSGDRLCRLGDARFGIVLAPMPAARLGMRDTIAERLSEVVREPLPVRGAAIRLTAALGHSAIRRRAANPPQATFKAAEAALSEALIQGNGSIRAYADGMGRARSVASELGCEVEGAIHSGAITPWFEPQICSRTGQVSGLDTVIRWDHPEHGLLGPAEIRPALRASGQMALFDQTMMHRAVEALAGFQAAGADIPLMSFGLSLSALQDRDLADRLAAEIRRYDLTTGQIEVEIPCDIPGQTHDDTVLNNLAALADNGHRLCLAAANPNSVPLLALQRFAIDRIRIDHSLVIGIDADPMKDQVMRAILALTHAMGMEALATGVETREERAHLANLGCDHMQGFGIARPIRADEVADWVRARNAAGKTIRLSERRAG